MNRASTHGNPIVHNRRYNQSEQKIQKAILKLLRAYRGRITARQVAKAAGLSRQTIYNHHANLNPKGMPAPAIGSERADMLVRMTVEVVSKWGVATECDIRRAGRYVNRWIRVVSDAAKKRLP